MSTYDTKVNATVKRFLSWNRISTNLVAYMQKQIEDGLERIFPESGLFTYPVTAAVGVAGQFTLSVAPPGSIWGIDNAGRVMEMVDDAFARVTAVPYEDDGVNWYWIGLKYCQVPSGIEINPRTGIPEYDLLMDENGETGNPSLVTDLAPGIRLTIPAAMRPYTGRGARVWLVDPESSNAGVAIQGLTIAFGGGAYYVDVPADQLGQTTVSLTITDYMIQIPGPTVYETAPAAANPFTDDYITFGYITTAGANAWSYADARDLSGGGGHTLQRAYDGLAGSGSGRQVNVDDQAMELRQGAAVSREDDIANASLRICKDLTTSKFGAGFEAEGAIDIRSRMCSFANILVRMSYHDTDPVTDLLRVEEAAAIAAPGSTITLTRPAADIRLTGATYQKIVNNYDMIELAGSVLGNNGLYIITTRPTALTCTVANFDGTIPALVAEAGLTIRCYRPNVMIGWGPYYGLAIHGMQDAVHEALGAAPLLTPTLSIGIPENAIDGDGAFLVERPGGDSFTITADCDTYTTGTLGSNGTISSLGGDISASVGDIKAVLGDIAALAGDVTAHVNITATTGDIHATAGDIIASMGKIEATAGDVIAGFDLEYGGLIKNNIGPSVAIDIPLTGMIQNVNTVQQWVYATNGDRRLVADGGSAICDVPVNLHYRNSLTFIEVIVGAAGAGVINADLIRIDHDYTAPIVPPVEVVLGNAVSVGAGVQKITLTPGAPEVISNASSYVVRITSAANLDAVYSMRANVDIDYIYPY